MNLARFIITTKHWGNLQILRPYPRPEEQWGDLAPLRGTPWGDLLPVVSGTSLSHALHGYAQPLMQQLGPHPHGLLRQVPEEYRRCRQEQGCIMASAHCHPSPKVPRCYAPPKVSDEAMMAASTVALAWAEGCYVIVVEGAEFSLSRGM